MKSIDLKIVGQKVLDKTTQESPAPIMQDDDPGIKRIESRPEGSLPATSEKIVYNTSEGKKKVYILISFMSITGVLDGKEVTVERPIEFFFPVGQGTSEHQWISATFRSLSLAARGGYCAQALRDQRKVSWDKGPVRCGVNEYGKPIYHDSEVAAIAWSLQRTLIARGFLDADGNQVPTRVLANPTPVVDPDPLPESESYESNADPVATNIVGQCTECDGNMRFQSGCAVCESCGFSKC